MQQSEADHFPDATNMIAPTAFLCASCGREVRMEWAAPCFGLCEACEEKVMAGPLSWPASTKEES
jgi:hypothetical protein